MDLNTLANLAEIIGAAIVVGGVAFAFVQLAHFRRQRHDLAAVELARSFETPEFAHALRLVLSLPNGVSAEQLRRMGSQFEDAAMLVSLTFESIAIMVHKRITTLDMVWELMGGVVLTSWARLRVWAEDVRQEQGREKFDEWIQWLCDQMERRMEPTTAPAYVQHREWKPKRISVWWPG
jgi:hypothetical protein